MIGLVFVVAVLVGFWWDNRRIRRLQVELAACQRTIELLQWRSEGRL